jgi:hypothetical protein
MKHMRTFLLLLLALSPGAAANDTYAPPPADAASKATIKGSIPVSSKKTPLRIFVLGVDGKRVEPEAVDWDKPLVLAAGKHMIAIGIRDHYAEVEIDACAGCAYTLQGTYEEQIKTFVKRMDIELWATQDSTGQIVSPKMTPVPRPQNVKIWLQRF